jgi:TolB protein
MNHQPTEHVMKKSVCASTYNKRTRRYRLSQILAGSLFFFFCQAHAALNLEITKGIKGTIPIAITPFKWQGTQTKAPENISQIITNDLRNSARFRLLLETSHNLPDGKIDLPYWQHKKVNALLSGSIQNQGNDQYQIHYVLTNVFQNPKTAEMKNDAVFGTKTGTTLSEQQFFSTKQTLRHTAHLIANQIFQILTGQPGIFTTHLAFVSTGKDIAQKTQYKLMLSDYDGHHVQTLLRSSTPIITPAFSPNAHRLAYVRFQDRQPSIDIINLQTGQKQQIIRSPGVNSAPAFSPDGKKLAVALSGHGGINLYEINLTSGEKTPITHNLSINTSPVYSSDGRSLYFTSTRGAHPQIYQYNLATHHTIRLTYYGQANMKPAVVGHHLVYLQKRGQHYQLMLYKNGQETPISATGITYPASIAPNGSMLVYSLLSANQRRLVLANLLTGQQSLLPQNTGDPRYVTWSPR